MFESNWKMVTRIDSLLRSVIAINQDDLISYYRSIIRRPSTLIIRRPLLNF